MGCLPNEKFLSHPNEYESKDMKDKLSCKTHRTGKKSGTFLRMTNYTSRTLHQNVKITYFAQGRIYFTVTNTHHFRFNAYS